MRSLIVFLALTAISAPAWTAEGMGFVANGEFRFRYMVDTDKDFDADASPSSEDTALHRFKLGATFRSGQRFTGYLGLIHSSTWGKNAADSDDARFDGLDAENGLSVNEAYGSWLATDELSFKAGRFGWTIADGSVIATDDWQQIPRSFEGILAGYDTEFAQFSFFTIRLAEIESVVATGAGEVSGDPERNLMGVSVDLKSLPDYFKMANIHLIQDNQDETDTTAGGGNEIAKVSDLRWGLAVGGEVMSADYRFVYASYSGDEEQDGTELDRSGSMMHLEAGYRVPEAMNMRFHFGYHNDSGDSDGAADGKREDYNPLFYNVHANAGEMDRVTWGNLNYFEVGIALTPMDDVRVGFEYFSFAHTEKVAGEDDLGTEMDLSATKKYGDTYSIGARYSLFTPGDASKVKGDDYAQWFLQGTMMF